MVTEVNYGQYKLWSMQIAPPVEYHGDRVLFGIDPGTTHMGLACVWRTVCHIFETKIKRHDDPVERIFLTQEIMSKCFTFFSHESLMVIEGSSFNDNYRQVELAEVRAAAVLWAKDHNVKASIIPPLSIRKVVLGSGRAKAEDEWHLAFKNAASALACAYYSIKV